MNPSGASEGPGPGGRLSMGTKGAKGGQAAQGAQRPTVKITPFHSSSIGKSDGALRGKRPAAAAASGKVLTSPGSLFRDTPGRLTSPPVRERLTAGVTGAAGRSVAHAAGSGSMEATTGAKAQGSPLVVKVNEYTQINIKHLQNASDHLFNCNSEFRMDREVEKDL